MAQHAVWFPSEEYKQQTRLYHLMTKCGFTDYDAFQERTVDHIDWFWDKAVKELDIEWFKRYEQTLDLSKGVKYPDWFVNGKLNATHLALEKWIKDPGMAKEKALIWESDDGENRIFTYEELSAEVNKAANGLHSLGLQKGDIVTLYLPMIPETLIAMLAISKIGAIFSPAFSGYKEEAVATRVKAAQSKMIITANGFHRRGKTHRMKEEALQAMKECPSIETMIVVDRLQETVPSSDNREVSWNDMLKNETDYKTEQMNADDPFMIIYTSGTTGTPKGALHTHSGFPIKSAFDAGIGMDVKKRDTLFWYTDMGWMMGPFLVYGGLVNGATIVMFEGTPDYPKPNRIWELVEKHNVSHLGISPTLIRSLMSHGEEWALQHDLSSLKVIGATGEPFNPEPWMWLFRDVGKYQIPIFNYSGGTEISGGMLGNVLVKPIGPVTFNAPLPGMDVGVYDKDGNPVKNEVGELVLLKPWVGMTRGFYKDNDRYERTYWNRWPDTWVHGDWVIEDDEGFYTITGRSDDTLNVAGKRTGPAEIESVLVEHDAVMEAGVIGIPHEVKGETPVAFVVLKSTTSATDAIKKEILEHATQMLGKAMAPSDVYVVPDLPKTRNAKVMRRAIKTAYLHEDPGDLSALENPEIVETIRKLGQPSLP
ncbi:AMP-binding protein [Pontibacillus salicampi]|uniref:acetate--CoA ligase n=1 Tax=Pontibacillus salicampi TaxID=1449801 RepID=A0ABV6LRC9_9BACI